jgi:CheY-like chemotaxis protein
LLTNALKFTDRGRIGVLVERDPKALGSLIRFTVSDTGIGIPPARIQLLFQEFSQLESSTTRRYGGTGLGLAISKRLTEAMGGTIEVDPAPGGGSVFSFTAVLPPTVAPSKSRERDLGPIASRQILVVDDNEVNRIVIEALLKRDGHSVAIATNGAEAVDAVRAGHFDLVFMDMQMPVMSGVDAAREIRKLAGPVRDVPIVALTANAMADEIDRCREAGMNGHLAKPIDRNLLRKAISIWTADTPPGATNPHRAYSSEAFTMVPQTKPDEPLGPITAWSDTPALGVATLLKLFDGDESSVLALLGVSIESIQADLLDLERSVTAMDMEAVAQSAHRLKGSAGSLGATRLLAASSSVEEAARKRPSDLMSPLLIALRKAVDEVHESIQMHCKILSKTSASPAAKRRQPALRTR